MFRKLTMTQAHNVVKYSIIGIWALMVTGIILIPMNNEDKQLKYTQMDEYLSNKRREIELIKDKDSGIHFRQAIEDIYTEYQPTTQRIFLYYNYKTTDYLNQRPTPSTTDGYSILSVFHPETIVHVVSIDDGWALLIDGTYVSAEYLEFVEEVYTEVIK